MTAADGADPRKERSRTRLLDAAESLMRSGGMSAVTVEAVTRRSTVARTTLYRHFHDVDQLRTATLERMLPAPPRPPAEGTVRERLIELLTQYAAAIRDSPTYLTTLAWLADDNDNSRAVRDSLRRRFLRNCVEPFDELLTGARATRPVTDEEASLVISRLLGPIVFVVLVGIGSVDRTACTRFVDDYLAARAPHLVPDT
ncbi:TetR/AcrR family transcriptional regulator [Nocardia bovistercoris]|uniref:TetR/AcrR family transcriptional regulator n=1 Tax=Nocardia bovistercoris TaxID=2785916 RepID=A0A931IE21_9NOCA|nr:TetR/AcrR family transcriptional regulator [Nocardia bovistercoris]MBH0778053.1 TetR/AcrR family transcriptional regulator [Nocardia bovistercoris]